jgi:hypothetical protein
MNRKRLWCSLVLLLVAMPILFSQNYSLDNTLPGNSPPPGDSEKQITVAKNLRQVVIVYKTHFDIGYSERVQQVIHDYRTSMADKVLDAIEKNKKQPKDKQFVWTVSGWPRRAVVLNAMADGTMSNTANYERLAALHSFPPMPQDEVLDN